MATFLGSFLIGGWYVLHKTVPPPVPNALKRNDKTNLYARVAPQKRRIGTGIAPYVINRDSQERLMNVASPAFQNQKDRERLLAMKETLWLESRIYDDSYDNVINERNPYPKYSGKIHPVIPQAKYLKEYADAERVEDRFSS
jgi:hypothetical protein